MLAIVFTIAQTVYLILGIIKLTPEVVLSNTITAAAPVMSDMGGIADSQPSNENEIPSF